MTRRYVNYRERHGSANDNQDAIERGNLLFGDIACNILAGRDPFEGLSKGGDQ
jgi:hypothetical protein